MRQPTPPEWGAFQREVARILRSPWTLATSADLRFSSAGVGAGLVTRVMHAYVDRVLRLGTVDPWARRRFLEVQGMMREVSAILRPDMLWRVVRMQMLLRGDHEQHLKPASLELLAHSRGKHDTHC
jgi:hypothetical protein